MKPKVIFIVGLLMILSCTGGFWAGRLNADITIKNWRPVVKTNRTPPSSSTASSADFSLFWTVWDKMGSDYVDKSKLDAKKMVDGAIAGMVSSVGDPYTVYLPAVQNKAVNEELGGSFEGVGMELGFKDAHLVVIAPLPDTPAAKAGIRAGDYVVRIQDDLTGVDRNTNGIALDEAVKIIRGKGGTAVKLTIVREGVEKPIELSLVRDTIVVKSLTLEFKTVNKTKFAYMRLSKFGGRTQDEFNKVVTEILPEWDKKAIKGIVLDLRNNPGGYLDDAVYIAGEFVPAGKIVVTQQYGDGHKIENFIERNGRLMDIPLVVIVNKGSASASEILSGALQDYKRAKIVGEQSFGKGSVQQPDNFPDGSGVHITVAKWLRPSNDWIDKKGITPDVVVKYEPDTKDSTRDNQLEKAVESL